MNEEEIVDAEIIEGVEVPRNEDVVEAIEHGMKNMYLSGPMDGIENYNHDLFNRIAQEFRAVGFMVCSPSEFFDGDKTKQRKEYMREAIKYLLEADTIVLLPGWEESKGARLEATIATELDLTIMEYVENDEQAAKLPPVGGTLSSMEEIKQAEGFHNLTLVDEEGHGEDAKGDGGGLGPPVLSRICPLYTVLRGAHERRGEGEGEDGEEAEDAHPADAREQPDRR